MESSKRILDVCSGSKMFWFNKSREDVIYMDIRELKTTLCDGRELEIKPDIIGDFREIPFEDNQFSIVIFDPPHLVKLGPNSWMAKKYGVLGHDWKNDIKKGFKECIRVLKPNGTLVFKWNEDQVKLNEILKLVPCEPLIGNKRDKTHWLIFIK